jgi:hypothetical protein
MMLYCPVMSQIYCGELDTNTQNTLKHTKARDSICNGRDSTLELVQRLDCLDHQVEELLSQGGGYLHIKTELETSFGRALNETEKNRITILSEEFYQKRAPPRAVIQLHSNQLFDQSQRKIKDALADIGPELRQRIENLDSRINKLLASGGGGYLHIKNELRGILGRELNKLEKDRITVLSKKSSEQNSPARVSVKLHMTRHQRNPGYQRKLKAIATGASGRAMLAYSTHLSNKSEKLEFCFRISVDDYSYISAWCS